ncbi:TerD family protein [Clostridium estertheticum]|uniref:TerD family protein n=1 Tax=Clostridium estertheticum TaxID=238834 RepID=UPI001CD11902|nr:TerD family protein [Clostridium estertheticum]MBN4049382.1 TerD family protein [bacterium AH-315-N14]MBZ9684883.1 TerD family protein [Clostridium estertheticum]
MIIEGSNKKITSQKKQYGKLTVETSIRPENNSDIVMGAKQHKVQNNVQSGSNEGPKITAQTKVNGNALPHKNMEKRKLVDAGKSIKLGKGQKLSINQNAKNLSKLIVTLDYNAIVKGHNEFDLDVSVFMVDINDKTVEKDFIFYENMRSTCGGIVISSDHNTYLKDAYNECIQLDLNLIPSHIQKLAFTVTIYEATERNQNFGQLTEGYIRILAGDSKQEILNYKFNDDLSIETAMVVAEIYRYKSEWKINCIGSGFRGGLAALCDNYGIETV